MTWDDLDDINRGPPSLVTIFRFRVSSLPVARCSRVLKSGFCQKEASLNFLPLTYNGEVTKLARSQVTDNKIPRYRYTFIDTVTRINHWKFQGDRSVGVAMTSIQPLSEVMSLDVTWWPDLEWPWSDIFTTYAEKMYEQVCPKQRHSAPSFFKISAKTTTGSKHPGPAHGFKLNALSRTCLHILRAIVCI